MPQEIIAIQCTQCKTLHSKEEGTYIALTARVQGHLPLSRKNREEAQFVNFPQTVVVCDNACLIGLLSLKGH